MWQTNISDLKFRIILSLKYLMFNLCIYRNYRWFAVMIADNSGQQMNQQMNPIPGSMGNPVTLGVNMQPVANPPPPTASTAQNQVQIFHLKCNESL